MEISRAYSYYFSKDLFFVFTPLKLRCGTCRRFSCDAGPLLKAGDRLRQNVRKKYRQPNATRTLQQAASAPATQTYSSHTDEARAAAACFAAYNKMGCGASSAAPPAVPIATSGPAGERAVLIPKPLAPVDSAAQSSSVNPRVAEVFNLCDKNGDGVLSKAELLIALRKQESVRAVLGINDVSEGEGREKFEQLFTRMDKDSNATVNVQELDAFMASLLQELFGASPEVPKASSSSRAAMSQIGVVKAQDGTVDRSATLKAVFEALDVDGSGELDVNEFRKAMDAEVGAANAANYFKWMDSNGDSMLSLEEWTSAVLQTEEWKDDMEFVETIKIWTSVSNAASTSE